MEDEGKSNFYFADWSGAFRFKDLIEAQESDARISYPGKTLCTAKKARWADIVAVLLAFGDCYAALSG